jgi:hypothetical protein
MPSEQPKAKAAKRRMVWSVINIACDASVKFDENEKCILVMLEPNDFARTCDCGAPHAIARGETLDHITHTGH